MIVKDFKTLAQLEEKLREVPVKKRKVIVLVGRHPNEGTINIAQRHHIDWEKYGAVVVKIPREWTPHHLWHTIARKRLTRSAAGKMHDDIPSDAIVIKFLYSSDFRVPFVNFHGSSTASHGEIKFLTTADSPRVFHDSFEKHWLSAFLHQAEVLAEFKFKGTQFCGRRLLPQFLERQYGFTPKTGLEPNYVNAKVVTPEDLNSFSAGKDSPSEKFNQVLKHLAETGLGKR